MAVERNVDEPIGIEKEGGHRANLNHTVTPKVKCRFLGHQSPTF